MSPWGFVALAYTLVWGAILLYFLGLRARLRHARQELAREEETTLER
jgi:hypothetical protein